MFPVMRLLPETALYRLYYQMLQDIHAANGRLVNKEFTFFQGMCGTKYTNDSLLVVGQATNGWLADFPFARTATSGGRAGILHDLDCVMMPRLPEPMQWLLDRGVWGLRPPPGYEPAWNLNRSAFWAVTRDIVAGLGIPGFNPGYWPHYVAWTNLYKVSPVQGGNPGTGLQNAQFQQCVEILNMEIQPHAMHPPMHVCGLEYDDETHRARPWRPRIVVFLTGLDWAQPFLNMLGFVSHANPAIAPVQEVGKLSGGACVVVAPHPRGQQQAPIVQGVLNAIRTCC